MNPKSTPVSQGQCPDCADRGKDISANNMTVYADGSRYCHACGSYGKKIFIDGEVLGMEKTRGITQETCKFYDYKIGQYTGSIGMGKKRRDCIDEWVRIMTWVDDHGRPIAQKIKTAFKEMKFIGNAKDLSLWGKTLFTPNDKLFITVTEGEEDAMAVAQSQGCQFPVVSLPNGCTSARKALESELQFLQKFKHVVLAFDNDEAGKAAVQDCLASDLFEPGKVKVCTWLKKDANDMLKAGMGKEITHCLFNAKVIEPDHIVTVENIIDKVMVQPQYGMDYPWSNMTNITYGYQLGEIHIIVGPTGIGKTEFIKEIIFHFLDKGMKAGIFSFEQNPDNTVRRLVGAKQGIKLHLPGAVWDHDKIKAEAMKFNEQIYLYDKAGKVDLQDLFHSIRYMARAKHVSFFVIDNLKALGVATDGERAQDLMNGLKTLCKDLNITTVLLSHVAKDKYGQTVYTTTSPKNADAYFGQSAEERDTSLKLPGMDWESGRMAKIENVEGGNIITGLADYVWALARNTTAEDRLESHTMRVKALKTRLDSGFTGKIFKLLYTEEGKLEESNAIAIFKDEDQTKRAF